MLDLSTILNSNLESNIKLIYIVMANKGDKFEELELQDLIDQTSLSSKVVKSTLKDPNFDIVREWADKLSKSKGSDKSLHGNTAKSILLYLNTKSTKKFKDLDVNLKFISARLKEGYTYEELTSIIDYKIDEWRDDDFMSKYIRPSTLFNKEKCALYLQELNGGEKVVEDFEREDKVEIIEDVSEEMIRLYGGM